MKEIKLTDDWLDITQLIFTKTGRRTKYYFSNFTFPLKFTSKIYHRDLMLQKANDDQVNVKILINKLNNDYNPKNLEKIKEKDGTLKSAKKLFLSGNKLLEHFRKLFFRT